MYATRVRLSPLEGNGGLRRLGGELFLAQRFARHASPLTTVVYTHPSDEEIRGRVGGLPS